MSTPPMPLQTESGAEVNRRAFWLGLLALVLLAGAFCLSQSLNDPAASGRAEDAVAGALPAGGAPLAVGDMPYDFTLADLDGSPVTLNDLVGRPLIINFWATWCAPCRVEMPELQGAFDSYRDQELVILALNQEESATAVRLFFRDEFGLTFTPLLDTEGAVARNYGVGRTLPSTFFIAPNGEITAVHRGPMTRSQIDDYLGQTLPDA